MERQIVPLIEIKGCIKNWFVCDFIGVYLISKNGDRQMDVWMDGQTHPLIEMLNVFKLNKVWTIHGFSGVFVL